MLVSHAAQMPKRALVAIPSDPGMLSGQQSEEEVDRSQGVKCVAVQPGPSKCLGRASPFDNTGFPVVTQVSIRCKSGKPFCQISQFTP